MSHFVVVVIGDDYESQLAPFDEEIRVESYEDYIDLTPRERGGKTIPTFELSWAARKEHLAKFCAERGITESEFYSDKIEVDNGKLFKQTEPGPIQKEFEDLHEHYEPSFDLDNPSPDDLARIAEILSDEDEEYGADEDGLYRWSSYNPQSKWDWYQVGGRWQGFFPVKEEAEGTALGSPSLVMGARADADDAVADLIRKGDVDFERARNESREAAEKAFDGYWEIIKNHPGTLGWSHFRSLVESGDLEIEQARTQYHDQPGYVALKETSEHGFLFGCPIDTFGTDRDAYIQRCIDNTLVPYAILHHGKWYQRSEMGWWGVSYNEQMGQDEWNAQVQKLYDSLDDDEQLTAVDCHI